MKRIAWTRNLVWNTDLIETIELEYLTDQAARDLYSGEVRHEVHQAGRVHADAGRS